MKQANPKIAIFSVERNDRPNITNEANHEALLTYLNNNGIKHKELVGCYKGDTENSVLVVLDEDNMSEYDVMAICNDYGQESYLISDETRKTDLVYLNSGKRVPLGKLMPAGKYEALNKHDSYTYDESSDTYWVTR